MLKVKYFTNSEKFNVLYDDSVELLTELYDELKRKITKIKFAIAVQHGKDYNEYKYVVNYCA